MTITGERLVWVGATGSLMVLALAMPLLVYFVHLRHAMDKLNKMDPPSAEVRISEDGLAVCSSLGTADIP